MEVKHIDFVSSFFVGVGLVCARDGQLEVKFQLQCPVSSSMSNIVTVSEMTKFRPCADFDLEYFHGGQTYRLRFFGFL